MKKLIALVTIFAAFTAVAGSRNGQVSKSLLIKSAASEADVVAQAEALIPGIVEFTNKKVRREAAFSNCSRRVRHIKLGSLTVSKVYKSMDNATLEPVFFGRLGYIFTKCEVDND